MTIDKIICKYNNNDITDLSYVLKNLPSCNTREFETLLSKISINNDNISKALDILNNENIENDTAYKAFFMLCYMYRRNKDFVLYGNIIKQYNSRFFMKIPLVF